MMLISDGISEETSKNYAVMATSGRYGTAKMRKMSRSQYYGDIHCSYLAGTMNAMAFVLDNHRGNAYETVDELVGDLQLKFVAIENYYKRKYNPKSDRRQLEEFLQ